VRKGVGVGLGGSVGDGVDDRGAGGVDCIVGVGYGVGE
jgi:hypothetical protein